MGGGGGVGRGPRSTMDSVLALHPVAPGSILGIPVGNYSLNVAQINCQQHFLVRGQCGSLIMLIGAI